MSQVLKGGNGLGCPLQNMFNGWASQLRDLREAGHSEVGQVPKSALAGITGKIRDGPEAASEDSAAGSHAGSGGARADGDLTLYLDEPAQRFRSFQYGDRG